MVHIGITGGIGAGKSLVCTMLSDYGVPIFHADSVAKDLSESDQEVRSKIQSLFGSQSYGADDHLNSQFIASIVFRNQESLRKLNAVVHPAVFRRYELWKSTLPPQTVYSVIEAALLFESGLFEIVDYVLSVLADKNIRTERTRLRDNLQVDKVTDRMRHQLSDEEFVELSDFIIYNDSSKESLQSRVSFYHHLFLNLRNLRPHESR